MTKISELPDLPGSVLGTDQIAIVRGGVTYKVAASALKTFANTDPTVVPSSEPFRGALVKRTTDATGITFPYFVAWQTEVYDTDGFWDIAFPSRLTIPAGITKVRLNACVAFEQLGNAGAVFASFYKNNVTLDPSVGFTMRQSNSGYSDNTTPIFSPVIDVIAGDYFEVRTIQSMTGMDAVLNSYRTFFALEVVEAA
jgi:hypothetical protein